jgi:hypothetical protein
VPELLDASQAPEVPHQDSVSRAKFGEDVGARYLAPATAKRRPDNLKRAGEQAPIFFVRVVGRRPYT